MEGTLVVKTFSSRFLNQDVYFNILKLKESFFIWIGTDASFKSLAIAMKSRLDPEPISRQLLGDATNNAASRLAQRLVKKSGYQCLVSMNVQDANLHPLIEDYVTKLLESEPQNFVF